MPVPVGYRWIVTDVECLSSLAGVLWFAAAGTAGAGTVVLSPAGGFHAGRWSGRLVVYGGEQLSVWSDPSGIDYVATGYQFVD